MRRRPEVPHECGTAAITLVIDAERRTPRSNANSSSGPYLLLLSDAIQNWLPSGKTAKNPDGGSKTVVSSGKLAFFPDEICFFVFLYTLASKKGGKVAKMHARRGWKGGLSAKWGEKGRKCTRACSGEEASSFAGRGKM